MLLCVFFQLLPLVSTQRIVCLYLVLSLSSASVTLTFCIVIFYYCHLPLFLLPGSTSTTTCFPPVYLSLIHMELVLLLLIFILLSRACLHLYRLSLLPTLTTDHNAVWKHHSWWRRLPDLICQPVHHHHKQVEVHDVIPPWLWTHLSSLPHVSAPSHCHSSPGFLMQFFAWFSYQRCLAFSILIHWPSQKKHHSMKPYWSAPSTWLQQLSLTSKVQHISLIPLVLENQHQNTSATLIWH